MPAVGRKDVFYQSESLLFEFLLKSLISSKNQHGEVNNDSGFISVLFFSLPLFNFLIASRGAESRSASRCSDLLGEPLLLVPSCIPVGAGKRRKYLF